MAAAPEDDKWLARMMRGHDGVRPDGGPDLPTHLDPDLLAAWADGSLRGKDLEKAEQHTSECPRCLALVAALQRTSPAPVEPVRTRSALLPWLVPIAAVATAMAIWIAIPEQRVTPTVRESAPAASPPAQLPAPVPAPPVAEPRPLDQMARPRLEPQVETGAATGANQAQPAAPVAPAPPPSLAAPAPPVETFSDTAATAQRSLRKSDATEAVAADPAIRWRIVDGRDVERSTDGGQTWVKTASPPGPLVSIRDVGAERATVVTADGRTLSTTDAGATWK